MNNEQLTLNNKNHPVSHFGVAATPPWRRGIFTIFVTGLVVTYEN